MRETAGMAYARPARRLAPAFQDSPSEAGSSDGGWTGLLTLGSWLLVSGFWFLALGFWGIAESCEPHI